MKQLSKRKVKERRKVGIVKAYMSRAVAVKKLQVPLSDFRRLCIMKGVYPVEPKNKSKLTGANTRRKTYFFTNDIQMLMNEPILHKFWEFKVFMKRLTRAKGRHDLEKFQQIIDNKPFYKLDTVVKERYPRFVDALRDCDDALSMCFLFAMFPKGPTRPDDLITLSRRLTVEFMHYVINSKSLRKVFISIKGYYYQAEIMGQTVTWMVPHQFVIERVSNVDLNVMKTYTEFYVTLLGFINYKLYKSISAVYPPQVVAENIKDLQETKGIMDGAIKKQKKRKSPDDEVNEKINIEESRDELIAALNKKIKVIENKSVTKVESEDQQPDVFEEFEENEKSAASDKTEHKEDSSAVLKIMALERLFEGLKFFLNRECPRESLTFIIRSFGGEVSWDKNLFAGATFDESDQTITHQIVDRSAIGERRLDRVYIQPQWVYDSINMRMLLPTADYLVGSTLPPHLSPFVNEKRGDYVPPDKIKMLELRKQYESDLAREERIKKGEAGVESDLETDTEFERATASESDEEDTSNVKAKKLKALSDQDKNDIDSFDSKRSRERLDKNRKKRERDSNKSTSRSKMSVKAGKLNIENKEELKKREDAEHRKMGIMMIPKKKKRLFDKITKTQKERGKKTEKMRAKRRIVDEVQSRQPRGRPSTGIPSRGQPANGRKASRRMSAGRQAAARSTKGRK